MDPVILNTNIFFGVRKKVLFNNVLQNNNGSFRDEADDNDIFDLRHKDRGIHNGSISPSNEHIIRDKTPDNGVNKRQKLIIPVQETMAVKYSKQPFNFTPITKLVFNRKTRIKGIEYQLYTEKERTKGSNALICFCHPEKNKKKLVYICANYPLCDSIARNQCGRCDKHRNKD